jgi:hypothetical protein
VISDEYGAVDAARAAPTERLSRRASLTMILLLSLGLWVAIWLAIGATWRALLP